jgi:hypothetical protein
VATARFQLRAVGAGLTWRLLATNNRDLACATGTFDDLAACRKAVAELQRSVTRLRAATWRTGPSTWGWRLLLADAAVVVSSRAYQRRVHAANAAGTALQLIPAAEVTLFTGTGRDKRSRFPATQSRPGPVPPPPG